MMMISQIKPHSGVKPTLQAKKPGTTNTQTNKATTTPASKGDTFTLQPSNKSLFIGGLSTDSSKNTYNLYKNPKANPSAADIKEQETLAKRPTIFSDPQSGNTVDATGKDVDVNVVLGAANRPSSKETKLILDGNDTVTLSKLPGTTVEITGSAEDGSVSVKLDKADGKHTNIVKLVGSKEVLEKAIANLKGGKTDSTTTTASANKPTGKTPTAGNGGKTEATTNPTETTSTSDLSPSSKAYQAKAKEAFLNSLAKNAPQLLANSVAEVEKEFTVVKKEDGTFTVTPKETTESKKPTNTDTNKDPFIEDNSNLA